MDAAPCNRRATPRAGYADESVVPGARAARARGAR
jgi:hypothetical protein